MATLKKNERSWAIELISEINSIAKVNDLKIKRAGGETTISQENIKMFPDVLLYGDTELTVILQGWELKMPDVPITDEVFVADAKRKAIALGLDSTVIWNFTYVKFFTYDRDTKEWSTAKEWENLDIKTREDVATYHEQWTKTLNDVVLTVNEYLLTHTVRTTIGEVISDKVINMLINENKTAVAENYRQAAIKDSRLNAYINNWWKGINAEYQFDETDPYKAYAKNVILNWAYRIIFAHLIKRHQSEAMLIDTLDYEKSPSEANNIFLHITSVCDFYNIFEKIDCNEILPDRTWHSLIELSLFLKENGINSINQSMLQNILDGSINTTRREMNGQFTTPKTLARILVKLTVHDLTGNDADVTCGTGTIPHAIITMKKAAIGVEKAVETTWASDKYQMPLQIANISMTSYDTINMASRLFKKNVFELKPGELIKLVNPKDGSEMEVTVPVFNAICSNLPFVSFENIPAEDIPYISKIQDKYKLSSKSDYSYFIALQIANLIEKGGYVGIIVSNSWLGTEAGDTFYNALTKVYNVLQVHISGRGRWFKNADVVTTMLILQKKSDEAEVPNTVFCLWKKSLDQITRDKSLEETIVESSLLDKDVDKEVMIRSSYSKEQIEELHNLNICYNSLFHDVSWLLDIKDCLVPLRKHFSIIRGSRRGWDKLFFPKKNTKIEKKFLYPAQLNAKSVDTLNATPDGLAFCCSLPLDELEKYYPNAYAWLMSFANQKNGKGKLLPKVLSRSNMYWYEMQPTETTELFTMLNPNERLFFGRFESPTFINQRLIGLRFIDDKPDKLLYQALLNSMLMQFFIESAGFGRGLGVLDMSKNHLADCYMLNPQMLSNGNIIAIKMAFAKVLHKQIMKVKDVLQDEDWTAFNHTILKAYGIDNYYTKIGRSLLSMQQVRLTVHEK